MSCGLPPRASCPSVVPNELVMLSCSVWPPVRFSIADAPLTAIRVVAVQAGRVLAGDISACEKRSRPPSPTNHVSLVIGVFVLLQAEVVIVTLVSRDEIDRVRVGDERRRGVERQPVAERS